MDEVALAAHEVGQVRVHGDVGDEVRHSPTAKCFPGRSSLPIPLHVAANVTDDPNEGPEKEEDGDHADEEGGEGHGLTAFAVVS